MLTLVFGAGASVDALGGRAGNTNAAPPLTKDLFNTDTRPDLRSYMARHPEGAGAFDLMRRRIADAGAGKIETTVERELRQLLDSAAEDPGVLVELMAIQCYLRELLWDCGNAVLGADAHITNYLVLVRALERWRGTGDARIAYVTFNYDCLLESALADAAVIPFDSISAYVRPVTAVFKAHGSVDWVRAIEQPALVGIAANDTTALVRGAAGVKWTDDYIKVGDPHQVRVGDTLCGPALAIPVESKAAYEMPPWHVEEMRRRLAETRHLLIVGWRARDMEFVEDLAAALLPNITIEIVTLTAEGGEQVEAALRDAGVTGTFRRVDGGFRRWIDDRLDGFVRELPRRASPSPTAKPEPFPSP